MIFLDYTAGLYESEFNFAETKTMALKLQFSKVKLESKQTVLRILKRETGIHQQVLML